MEKKEFNKIIKTLEKEKCVCLLAPSFPVDYKYPEIVFNLRKIGFNKIFELTYAAKIINMNYHEIIEKNPKKQYIAANCPCVVNYIQTQHTNFKKNIMNVASPMVIMARYSKKKYPKYKTIFIGPCFAKKEEAKKYKEVNFALTFKELEDLFSYFKENNKLKKIKKNKINLQFDLLYNDYTKIYPLSGAVAQTMHYKNILKKNQILIADGVLEINQAIEKLEKNKNYKFLDALFCKGGCIGGPGIKNTESTRKKINKIKEYRKKARKEKIGKHKGLFKYSKNIKIER